MLTPLNTTSLAWYYSKSYLQKFLSCQSFFGGIVWTWAIWFLLLQVELCIILTYGLLFYKKIRPQRVFDSGFFFWLCWNNLYTVNKTYSILYTNCLNVSLRNKFLEVVFKAHRLEPEPKQKLGVILKPLDKLP